MEYLLVASPKFVRHYFSTKDQKRSLITAPAVKFDKNDTLHERYLEKYFGLQGNDVQFHIVPSVRGFKKCIQSGYGYGLIPRIDILKELKEKSLIHLHTNKVWNIALYWHYWDIESKFYKQFNAGIITHAKRVSNS